MTITANITTVTDSFQVVEINSSEASYGTEAIKEAINAVASLPTDATKGVVISHRGAIWVHSAIAHHFHIAAWVGHYDPRLNGAVVVQSHKRGFAVGDVIEIPKPAA